MKERRIKYKVGTLLDDNGRLGMIVKHYPKGESSYENAYKLNWQTNYHVYFASIGSYIIGTNALERLVEQGTIKIVAKTTTSD